MPTVLWLLFDFLSLKNYVIVPWKSNKQIIFVDVLEVTDANPDPDPLVRSIDPRDQDPYQNFMGPQHLYYIL
jgi:hypothetical protein